MADIKILYAASNVAHMERFHGPYIRRLAEGGGRVYSLCGSRAKLDGIYRHIDLGFKKSLWSPRNFFVALKLAKIIRAERFGLIWTHTSLAAFFVRLAVLLAGKGSAAVVNTVHGYLFDDRTPLPKRKLLLAAEKLTARATDMVMTMNDFDFRLAVGERLAPKVVKIDGVGVDYSRFKFMEKRAARSGLGLPERAFVLIYAAEFSRRKNQSFLIKCMGRLPEGVVLVLAGKGALEKECRELAVREGVSGRVVFAGQIEDLSPYYSAADVCVSSSRSEGLPFNIMEGLHYSLPAVATRVKGHEDLITQGENGFLYDYGDGEAFCGYVERLAGNEVLRRGLGARARESVEKYSLERVLPAVLSLLPLAGES